MNYWKNSIVAMLMLALACSGVILVYKKRSASGIRDLVYEKDKDAINALFHQGENWYWLISDFSSKTYSVDFMLEHKSSSQFEKLYDLLLKVLEVDGKIVGFFAYYPKSLYTWQFLFLVIDENYRSKGLAYKLLSYAIDDMVHRGAIKVELVTRPVNVRAKSLYNKFGFKQVGEDQDFAYFSWHKSYKL